MKNKELEKNTPVELDDAALENVSGGRMMKFDLTRPVIKGDTSAQQDDGAQGSSHAGGIAG